MKPEDRRENEVAIILHMRIMSVYLLKSVSGILVDDSRGVVGGAVVGQ